MADIKNHSTLPTNLEGYWELEEANGTRVDSHGSNDLTENGTGGVANESAKIGNGALFASADTDYLDSSTDPGPSGDWSVAGWVDFNTVSRYSWLFYSGVGTNTGFGVRFENDNKIFAQFGTASTVAKTRTTSAHVSSTGTWYHVAVTADVSAGEAGITIYVNNSSVATTSVTDTATSMTAVAHSEIGGAAGGQTIDGTIDEVGVWSKVLTSGEVSDLYNSGSGIPYEEVTTFIPNVMIY